MAAMSARFCAAAFHPTSLAPSTSRAPEVAALDHEVGRRDDPAVGAATTAASSPGPTSTAAAGRQPGEDPGQDAALPQVGESRSALGLDRHAGHGTVAARVTGRSRSAAADEEVPVVVQAYILIQTEVGKSTSVAAAISDVEGVLVAEDVTGPYDVIARVEAHNVDELGKLVIARVQEVPGITRTLTCTVVHI